ncbi:MAG: hypothetical protein IT269_08640, partial [Saprospiraceae bacterium]|nr:hypothetical protein [Saprospiraceae bacterium]
MKRLLLSVAVLMSIAYSLFAQCPPPNFPNPGYTCQTAPVLCPTLDGYCVNTGIAPPVNPTPTIPGCQSQYVFNNPIWFGFFAGTTSISIHLTANNCVGSQNGIQAGIYDNCISQSMALQCACSNDFTLTANNFVVGEVYWFFIDGCGGADCDISIDVTVGSTVSFPPNPPTMINGPITACGGTSTAYNVALVPGATSYAWTTNPPIGTITTNPAGNNATIAWPNNASGPVDVCVAANNACYPNNPPICTTIVLTPKPTAVISGSGVVCAGGSGSPANLTVTFTGEGPWTFTPTLNGTPQPPAITTNDNPYTLSVTQAGNWGLQGLTGSGCAGTTSGVAPVTLVNISPTISPTAATCGQSNGNLNLTVTGGATPYDYDWSNGETTEDLTGFPPGTYTVTVTDNNGCTKTQTATINNNPVAITITPTITANTTCIGGNGSISVNVTPGTLPYTYAWNNGETTTSITGLTPGTYTITVTGGLTCTQTASFTVPNTPNLPNGTATPTGSTCALDNGAINLTPSGGISPYMFSWSNGETTEDLSNLLAGTYTVTITGDNGCTRTVSATVSNTNPPFTVTPTIVANTTCNGGNGSISLSVAPASGTYTFSWANGDMTNSL